ncbi:MAG: hypothetical protein MPN21_05830 [Thermoanaerobaculia bacterium]|nr:hypothetical protein [Thermoanaerobaculia bacterium]
MRFRNRALASALLAVVLVWPAVAQGPVGNEFQVNSYTTDGQGTPDVAFRADGSFVVVWETEDQGTCPVDIFANRFVDNGAPIGTESQQSDLGSGLFQRHLEPSVDAAADGDFVVAWYVNDQDGTYRAYGRLFSSTGAAQAPLFMIDSNIPGPRSPDVARQDTGSFVVVWDNYGDLLGQRFSDGGAPSGSQFALSADGCGGSACQGSETAIDMDGDGNFVVAWNSYGADGDGSAVLARRFDSAGAAQGSDLLVNTETFDDQARASVTVARDGSFLVAWSSQDTFGNSDVRGQFYDRNGVRVGEELLIDAEGGGPSAAVDAHGRFAVHFSSFDEQGNQGIYSRAFDSQGGELSPRFQVSSVSSDQRFAPSLSATDGAFVAVWTSEDQDGSATGVFGSRCVLKDDFIAFKQLPGALPSLALENAGSEEQGLRDDTALVDLDGDEELEVVRNAAGLAPGATARLDTVDGVSDPDPDVVAVGGHVRAVVDVDGDGELEVVIENSAAAGGTVSRVNTLDGVSDADPDLIFIGGTFAGLVDVDGDGELEVVVEDSTAAPGSVTRVDNLDGVSDADPDVVFVGGTFAAVVDVDSDGEPEVVIENDAAPGIVTRFDTLDGVSDADPDVVFVGGTFAAMVDLDDDGEKEAVVENTAAPGVVTRFDTLDGVSDADPDVVFVGGTFAAAVDLDDDFELEAVVEDAAASAGSVARENTLDGVSDADPDVVFVGGTFGGTADLDGDGELEAIVANLLALPASVTRVDTLDGVSDADPDVVFTGGVPVAALDVDGDGEFEVLVEDGAAVGGTVTRVDTLDGVSDPDPDVVFVGGTLGAVGDVDGDCEVEAVVENPAASGGSVTREDTLDGVSDADPDIVFVGGLVAGTADVDGDSEPELFVVDPGAAFGNVSRVDTLDGVSDADPDVVFTGGLPIGTADLDDDGELEVVAEDESAALGTASRVDTLDGVSDADPDVVFVGSTALGTADLDDDGEAELLVQGAAGGTTVTRVDTLDGVSDADADIVFFGTEFAFVTDLDGDEELEAVVSSDAVTAGDVVAFRTLDGVSDGDDDIVFIGGLVAAAADLDADGSTEAVADDDQRAAGTFDTFSVVGEGGADPVVIFVGTGAAELLTLVAPNVGESLDVGSSVQIQWSSTGLSGNVRIELSRDGGATFETLFGNTANDGAQNWNVTGPATTQALIRVSSRVDPSIFDESDGTFTIPAALLAVVTPNGGESLEIGSSAELQWSSSNLGGNVRVELSRDGGATFETLFGNTANDGAQNWNVTGPPTSDARLRITSRVDGTVLDESDASFTILPASLTVLSPNGGESLDVGSQVLLAWSSTNLGGNVRIELSRDGGATFEILFGNTADDGVQAWNVVGPATTDGLLRVSSRVDGSIVDQSDTVFTINSPSLAVLTPNGGETVTIGQETLLAWSSSNLGGNVRIELSRDGGATFETLFGNTPNDGFQTWNANGPPSTDALLRVSSRVDGSVVDESDGFFTIPAAALTVVSPSGGESFEVGSQVLFEWTSANLGGTVRIELSRDGGATFETLFGNTLNDGLQVWTVDGPPTTQAVLRVSSRVDGTVADESGGFFSIPAASLTVLSPDGGETLSIGTPVVLEWSSSNLGGNVRLELSRDGGATFETLFGNTPDDGFQIWNVTGPATAQALVRVTSRGDGRVVDQSDSIFQVN